MRTVCEHCRHELSREARLCAWCGEVAHAVERAPVRPRRGEIAVIAGVAALLLLAVTLVPRFRREEPMSRIRRQLGAVFTIGVLDSSGVPLSQGSGFLVGTGGLAVSAMHVLRGAERAEARFPDGRLYDVVTVEASDSAHDAVVFRIGRLMERITEYPTAIAPLALRRGGLPAVGERVAVVGSPEGLGSTLSDGLVSAHRPDGDSKLLQISAPISPGSSGGPVFDVAGRVVGVVVQQMRDGQNLNFAEPAHRFRALLDGHAGEPLAAFGARTRGSEEASLYDELFERGNVLFARRRYEDALQRYELATRVAPESASALYNAAMCLQNLGREREAADRFRRYLALEPARDDFYDFATRWLSTREKLLRP